MKRYTMFIDGEFVRHTGPMIPVINPATEEVVSEVPAGGPEHVEAAVTAAERAQKAWAKRPAVERAGYLREIAQAIRRKADPLARTIVEEQGKVLPLAKIEVLFTADYLDYMAEFARRYRGGDHPERSPQREHPAVQAAPRSDRGDPALELPLLPHRPQDGPGPGDGQHHRHQAQQRNAQQRLRIRRHRRRELTSPRACSTWCRGREPWSATPSPVTPASAWSA